MLSVPQKYAGKTPEFKNCCACFEKGRRGRFLLFFAKPGLGNDGKLNN
jgi:hypothetical protein